MTKSIVVLAALLTCGISHAASVTCTGRTLDYAFTVKAQTSGSRVPGQAMVIATKGGAPMSKGNLPITSSTFVAHQKLQFVAAAGPNRVAVDAVFDQGNNYNGTLAMSGAEGSTSVATVCVVK